MIGFFGKLALDFALFFAFCQSVPTLWGLWRKNPYAIACARPSAWGQFIALFLAYLLLTCGFITNDFSLTYVAQNSHPTLPLLYRLTAVWGAHEGSFLLWTMIFSLWTMAFTLISRKQAQASLVIAILGLINFCFLNFLILTSNPFVTTQEILTGNDLNPLLQDPGFIIHPPMLFAGYVGFAIAFALTQAALITRTLDAAWARTTRDWALAAWCFLTLGILLGSWWAYRVLGWGGFWFWDPVENASLLPWLAGTAFVHTLLVVEKRDIAKGWAAFLAIVTFGLSLLGTFLVRSGILISAHTFASDPARGLFLLILFALLVSATLILYLSRMPLFTPKNPPKLSGFAREVGLLLNSALLFIMAMTILLGTLYPLIVDVLGLGNISVGAPYFNRAVAPLLFILMFSMGLGPLSHWQTQSTVQLFKYSWKKAAISILAAIVLPLFLAHHFDFLLMLGLAFSFWIIASILSSLRFLPGMSLAHFGFAVLVLGIVLSHAFSKEEELKIKTADKAMLGPYTFYFSGTEGISGPNYKGIRGYFHVTKNKHFITELTPEKRIYTVRDMVMTKVSIQPGIFRDLYIALGEPLPDDTWTVRLYYKPFIRWIWLGGIIMILGGILTLIQRNPLKTGRTHGKQNS